MSVLSDKSIRKLALEEAMISPFVDKQVRDGKISYARYKSLYEKN